MEDSETGFLFDVYFCGVLYISVAQNNCPVSMKISNILPKKLSNLLFLYISLSRPGP